MRNFLIIVVGVLLGSHLLAGCSNDNSNEAPQKANDMEGSTKNNEVKFYIVRHGETMLNTTDRVQGWSDAVLTPDGKEIVQSAGKGLKDVDFSSAYTSDSGRAVETANIILDENESASNVELNSDERLREFNFGSYEGDLNETMWNEIAENQGITLDEFLEDLTPKDFANNVAELDKDKIEEGENWPAEDYETITDRLTEAIHEIAEEESENGGGNVLVTSHGLSIGALLDSLSDDFELPSDGLDNASVSTVNYKEKSFHIEEVNDMSYVKEGKK